MNDSPKTLHHLTGKLFWYEQGHAIVERNDREGQPLETFFGRFLRRASATSLEGAWAWVDDTQDDALSFCEDCDGERDEDGCPDCDRRERSADERADIAYDAWRDDRMQGELF